MGLAKKRGMGEMLKIASPLFGEGRLVAEERGCLVGKGGQEGQGAVALPATSVSLIDNLSEVDVGGQILVAWASEGVGGWGVLAKGDESARGSGGVIKVGCKKTVIESEEEALLDFLGEKLHPWGNGGSDFGAEVFDGGNGPVMDLSKKFGGGGLIEPIEVVLIEGDPTFVPLAGVEADEANGKAIDQFTGVKVGGFRESGERYEIRMPVDGEFGEERVEGDFLFLGKCGRGFDQVKVKGGEEMRVLLGEGGEDVEGEVCSVSPLFDEMKSGGGVKKGVKFSNLKGEELAEHRARGDGGKKISLGSRAGLA